MSYWEEDDRVEHLMWLWAKGFSASVCAGKLGGVTRSAVLSKIDRLRDAGYDVGPMRTVSTSREQRKAARAKPFVPAPVTQRSIVAEVMGELPVDPTPLKETYMPPVEQMRILDDLEDHHCRWPIGDPKDSAFRFCAGKKVFGLPYCEYHVRDAFAPPRPRISPVAGVSVPAVEMEPATIQASAEAPEMEREGV